MLSVRSVDLQMEAVGLDIGYKLGMSTVLFQAALFEKEVESPVCLMQVPASTKHGFGLRPREGCNCISKVSCAGPGVVALSGL